MGRLSSADGCSKELRLTSRRSVTACRHLTLKAFYDSGIYNCVSEIMWLWGGFIQVGVASSPRGGRGSLVCGGRCLIARSSLMPWHWLFRLGLKDLDGCLSNISGALSQTDLKCCVTDCGGLFQNLVGQLDLF